MAKPRIMFDTDARHPLIYMYEPPMQKEEYESAVDEITGTPVEGLTFSLGDTQSLLHDSKVGGMWGEGINRWPHIIWKRARQNADALIADGNDPLKIICDRAREKGILIYPSIFVQQGGRERFIESWIDEKQGDEFSKTGGAGFKARMKDLHIGSVGDMDPDDPATNCYDFKHAEIRNERSALIQETLNNYEIDGLELHLSYTPYYFHPNNIESGRKIMTSWISDIYERVKTSNKDRELIVRIPTNINSCISIGLDPVEWIRSGIVDAIVAEPLNTIDPMADFRPLVQASKGSECRIIAGLPAGVVSDRQGTASIEVIRAAACNYWAQGIDGIYLTGWYGSWPYTPRFYAKLREVAHPDIMAPKDKYYVLPTTGGRVKPMANETLQLPLNLDVDVPASVTLEISDDLPLWNSKGRVHEVLLRIRLSHNTEIDKVEFKLNGTKLPEKSLRKINELYRMTGPRMGGGAGSGYWNIFRLEKEYWPVKGKNTIEFTLLKRDPHVLPSPTVHFVELETRYLMGKNFHRSFVDSDLGPYDGPEG